MTRGSPVRGPRTAKPGDKLWFNGPGGAYLPNPEAGWHLLVGDESALPAIGAAIEQLPAGARAKVFVEVENESEEQKLDISGEVELTWFHRTETRGADLVRAVEELEFPSDDVHVFVHGEAGFVTQLRRHLHGDRGLPRDRVSHLRLLAPRQERGRLAGREGRNLPQGTRSRRRLTVRIVAKPSAWLRLLGC